MIAKLLEALFRHKFLILLPVLLTPLVASAYVVATSSRFEASAGVWVERATYLSSTDELERFSSAAESQAGRLTELLRTRAFMTDVALRTSLAPLADSEEGLDRLQQLFSNDLEVATQGSHLVNIRFRADTPDLSYSVVAAIVDAFKRKSRADRLAQADLAISFYTQQMKEVEPKLVATQNALRNFVAANSTARAGDSRSSSGLLELELSQLKGAVERAQADVDRARSSLEQARLDSAASLKGQELGFQVIDPPTLPPSVSRPRLRKMLPLPAAALVLGIGVGAGILVVFVAADRSVRSAADLPAGTRLLGTVPYLRPRNVPRGAAHATRRAVGFAAGAALQPRGGE